MYIYTVIYHTHKEVCIRENNPENKLRSERKLLTIRIMIHIKLKVTSTRSRNLKNIAVTLNHYCTAYVPFSGVVQGHVRRNFVR